MWQGIKKVTGNKDTQMPTHSTDSTVPNTLDQFFALFDQCNGQARTRPILLESENAPNQLHLGRASLGTTSVRKAAGPDGVTGLGT